MFVVWLLVVIVFFIGIGFKWNELVLLSWIVLWGIVVVVVLVLFLLKLEEIGYEGVGIIVFMVFLVIIVIVVV